MKRGNFYVDLLWYLGFISLLKADAILSKATPKFSQVHIHPSDASSRSLSESSSGSSTSNFSIPGSDQESRAAKVAESGAFESSAFEGNSGSTMHEEWDSRRAAPNMLVFSKTDDAKDQNLGPLESRIRSPRMEVGSKVTSIEWNWELNGDVRAVVDTSLAAQPGEDNQPRSAIVAGPNTTLGPPSSKGTGTRPTTSKRIGTTSSPEITTRKSIITGGITSPKGKSTSTRSSTIKSSTRKGSITKQTTTTKNIQPTTARPSVRGTPTTFWKTPITQLTTTNKLQFTRQGTTQKSGSRTRNPSTRITTTKKLQFTRQSTTQKPGTTRRNPITQMTTQKLQFARQSTTENSGSTRRNPTTQKATTMKPGIFGKPITGKTATTQVTTTKKQQLRTTRAGTARKLTTKQTVTSLLISIKNKQPTTVGARTTRKPNSATRGTSGTTRKAPSTPRTNPKTIGTLPNQKKWEPTGRPSLTTQSSPTQRTYPQSYGHADERDYAFLPVEKSGDQSGGAEDYYPVYEDGNSDERVDQYDSERYFDTPHLEKTEPDYFMRATDVPNANRYTEDGKPSTVYYSESEDAEYASTVYGDTQKLPNYHPYSQSLQTPISEELEQDHNYGDAVPTPAMNSYLPALQATGYSSSQGNEDSNGWDEHGCPDSDHEACSAEGMRGAEEGYTSEENTAPPPGYHQSLDSPFHYHASYEPGHNEDDHSMPLNTADQEQLQYMEPDTNDGEGELEDHGKESYHHSHRQHKGLGQDANGGETNSDKERPNYSESGEDGAYAQGRISYGSEAEWNASTKSVSFSAQSERTPESKLSKEEAQDEVLAAAVRTHRHWQAAISWWMWMILGISWSLKMVVLGYAVQLHGMLQATGRMAAYMLRWSHQFSGMSTR